MAIEEALQAELATEEWRANIDLAKARAEQERASAKESLAAAAKLQAEADVITNRGHV